MPFLLERLAAPSLLSTEYEFDLRDAIKTQIQRLLSIRAIESADDIHLLNLGCGSVVEVGFNNKIQLQRYANQLQRLIARYEPRLVAPQVRVQAGSDSSRTSQLVINGSLAKNNEAEIFYFELPLH